MKDRSWLLGARSARGARNLRRTGVKVKPVYRKRKGEALQMACGVCARSTRRAASLPGEGSTHLRGCGMTAVATNRTSSDVRRTVAIGGNPDMTPTARSGQE